MASTTSRDEADASDMRSQYTCLNSQQSPSSGTMDSITSSDTQTLSSVDIVKQIDIERNKEIPASSAANSSRRTAWLQVLASFLINMNVYGLVNAFGDFQHFYETELLSAYSSSTISWIGTTQAALGLLVGALAGPLFDNGYFLIVMRIASGGLVFSWMMLSLSTQYYQVMLTQGILAGSCVGLLEVPSMALIPVHFQSNLGLAMGLSLSGAPFGGLLYSLVFRSLLTNFSFAWATRGIGCIGLVTLSTAAVIIRPKDRTRRSPHRRFIDWSALCNLPFISLLLDFFFAYCAALVPNFLTPSFAVRLAHPPSKNLAYHLLAVLNAAQILGRILPAFLSDHLSSGATYLLLFAQLLIAVLGLSWISITSLSQFIPWLIFTGFFAGMVATLPPSVIPHVSPDERTLGTRIGMVWAAAGFGVLIGNPVALATVKRSHNTNTDMAEKDFLGAQLWMGLCAAVGTAFYVLPAIAARRNIRVKKELAAVG